MIYLPYKDFNKSTSVLRDKDLLHNRRYISIVLNRLDDSIIDDKYKDDIKLWLEHKEALAVLGYATCMELISRDRIDKLANRYVNIWSNCPIIPLPKFLDNLQFHESCQAALLRLEETFYRPMFPYIPITMEPYYP